MPHSQRNALKDRVDGARLAANNLAKNQRKRDHGKAPRTEPVQIRLFCERVSGFIEVSTTVSPDPISGKVTPTKIRKATERWLDEHGYAVEDVISEYLSPSGWWIVRWRGSRRIVREDG